MKYSSSCRNPYRPLTASSAPTNTAAITHARTGTRSEAETGTRTAGPRPGPPAPRPGPPGQDPRLVIWQLCRQADPRRCLLRRVPPGSPRRATACRTTGTRAWRLLNGGWAQPVGPGGLFSAIQSLLVSLTGRLMPPATTCKSVWPETRETVTWVRNSRVEPVPTTILSGRCACDRRPGAHLLADSSRPRWSEDGLEPGGG
jgi:hypothetical protein